MSIVVHPDRPRSRGWSLASLVVFLGIAVLVIYRASAPSKDGTGKPVAERAADASAIREPAANPSVPTNTGPKADAPTRTGSATPQPAQSWQVSLQPVVVAATRVDALAAYQVQLEKWSCDKGQCVGDLRVPPNVDGSHRLSTAAEIYDKLRTQMAQQDINVAIGAIHPGAQGLAMSLQFNPMANVETRVYTAAEIAEIRLDSFEQGRKAAAETSNDSAAHTTH